MPEFSKVVQAQIELLQGGDPLGAIDIYYADNVQIFANSALFAENLNDCREKQAPFIDSAASIEGKIEDLYIDENAQICVFRNLTTFSTSDGQRHQIDGICWQRWKDGKIIVENYFDGEQMKIHIDNGIMNNPASLIKQI